MKVYVVLATLAMIVAGNSVALAAGGADAGGGSSMPATRIDSAGSARIGGSAPRDPAGYAGRSGAGDGRITSLPFLGLSARQQAAVLFVNDMARELPIAARGMAQADAAHRETGKQIQLVSSPETDTSCELGQPYQSLYGLVLCGHVISR
jgi:hypothetical protein